MEQTTKSAPSSTARRSVVRSMVRPASHSPFIRSASRYTRSSPSALMSTRASVLPRSDGSRNSVASELRPKLALPAPMITILTGFILSLSRWGAEAPDPGAAMGTATRGVYGVHDERRVLDDPVVVDAVVPDGDDHGIARVQLVLAQLHGVQCRAVGLRGKEAPAYGEDRHVRVVVADLGTVLAQQLDETAHGRVAVVVDVGLEGHPQHQHARVRHGHALQVEGRGHEIVEVEGHAFVDRGGVLDEARVKVILPRLPAQVERIDGDAMAPDARARREAHVAKRLCRGRVNHFPDV